MRKYLVFAVVLASACDEWGYRGIASSLNVEKSCYELEPTKKVTVRVQAVDGSSRPVPSAKIKWTAVPAAILLDPAEGDTTTVEVSSWRSDGVATTELSLPDMLPEDFPVSGMVLASSAVDDQVLTTTAELRIVRDESSARCPVDNADVDAGSDALEIDAQEIDAP